MLTAPLGVNPSGLRLSASHDPCANCGQLWVDHPLPRTCVTGYVPTAEYKRIPATLAEACPVPERKDTNPKDAVANSKLPLWLLSPIAKAHWAVAQAVGMVKYGAWNWRVSGVRSSIYLSAIQRHFDRYLSGEDYDPVDGQHNLGAIMACCAILLDAEAAGKLNDDRPPSVGVQDTYDLMEKVFKASIERAQAAGLNPVHHTIKESNAI